MDGPILVIDDDEAIRSFLQLALTAEGYAVETAGDARSALAVVAHTRPGLILLDYDMDDMDGAEFGRAYRSIQSPPAPLLVLTAGPDGRTAARQAGADEFLSKPFELDHLLEVVERHVPRGTAGKPERPGRQEPGERH